MKKYLIPPLLLILLAALFLSTAPVSAQSENACWGQATKVFAQMGAMGEHSSSFDTPRLGLKNLARYLYSIDAVPDASMQSLGVFVAAELGLDIEACR